MSDDKTVAPQGLRGEQGSDSVIGAEEVYTIFSDTGGRIVFYSDRSVHWINRHGSSEVAFRNISTVDALRESNMRAIMFTTGVVAVGLVLGVYLLGVHFGRAIGGAIVSFFVIFGALLLKNMPRAIWHLRVSNSSGGSKLLVSSASREQIIMDVHDVNEALHLPGNAE
jgi:hypothetical protein